MKGIYRGLSSANPKVRAGSRELLENLLAPPATRRPLLALVDDAPLEERLRRAARLHVRALSATKPSSPRMLEESGESLRCVAAHLVGELGLIDLRPRLESHARCSDTGFFLARVVERALSLLAQAAPGPHV